MPASPAARTSEARFGLANRRRPEPKRESWDNALTGFNRDGDPVGKPSANTEGGNFGLSGLVLHLHRDLLWEKRNPAWLVRF